MNINVGLMDPEFVEDDSPSPQTGPNEKNKKRKKQENCMAEASGVAALLGGFQHRNHDLRYEQITRQKKYSIISKWKLK